MNLTLSVERYFIEAMRQRVVNEYPLQDIDNEKSQAHKYFRLKYSRAKSNEVAQAEYTKDAMKYMDSTRIIDAEEKLESYIMRATYAPGIAGLQWMLDIMDIPDLNSRKWEFNSHYTNIQQYYDKDSIGKIISCTSIDKNGAYVAHFRDKLPVEEINEYEEGCVVLYTSKITGRSRFVRPTYKLEDYELTYFRTDYIKNADKWLKSYERAIEKYGKRIIKTMAVAAIGFMSTRHPIIARYIWFKQGQEIKDLQSKLLAAGLDVVKIHTDSITWVHDSKIKFDIPDTYKVEQYDNRMYMVNSGLYQFEGDRPRGIVNYAIKDKIEYEDGVILDTMEFPCLRVNQKYKALEKGNCIFKAINSVLVDNEE